MMAHYRLSGLMMSHYGVSGLMMSHYGLSVLMMSLWVLWVNDGTHGLVPENNSLIEQILCSWAGFWPVSAFLFAVRITDR